MEAALQERRLGRRARLRLGVDGEQTVCVAEQCAVYEARPGTDAHLLERLDAPRRECVREVRVGDRQRARTMIERGRVVFRRGVG